MKQNKIWLAVGGMLAPGVVLSLLGVLASVLGAVLPPSLAVGAFVIVFAFTLLIMGIVFAALTIIKAREMDDV